jgi:hypothetical protein
MAFKDNLCIVWIGERVEGELNNETIGDVATGGFRVTDNFDDLRATKAIISGDGVCRQHARQLRLFQATRTKSNVFRVR